MKGLQWFLNQYYQWQEQIILVYRPPGAGWGDRCQYLGEGYSPFKKYNHRSILRNEVVIEYDNADEELNRDNAYIVSKRLKTLGINHSLWSSGGKSIHVHLFIGTPPHNNQLLKKTFIKYLTKDLPSNPDMQLCADNHLIRAEYGLHEKTGNHKTLIYKSKNYPQINEIPQDVIYLFQQAVRERMARKLVKQSKLHEMPSIKYLFSPQDFRLVGDGHERALFILIHALKDSYNSKEDLTLELQQWYGSSGGKQLSMYDIKRKVDYHYSRSYHISENYVKEFLEELGQPNIEVREPQTP